MSEADSSEKSDGAKSASAVFIPVADIEDAALKTVQNSKRGITLKLRGGNSFELVFMPGVCWCVEEVKVCGDLITDVCSCAEQDHSQKRATVTSCSLS